MRRWPYTFAVSLSVVVTAVAIYSSVTLGLPLKDPEGFLGPAYVRLPLLGLMFFAAGIIPAAIKRSGVRRLPSGVVEIVRDEWSLKRVAYIATGLITFYACYVSYRNLKSYLPVYRDTLYDKKLLDLDHWLAFGQNPAELLHNLLGTSISAEILSVAYVAYLPLVPVTLGAFLVLNRDLSIGAWYATALGLNWVLGVVSYYLVPTLGPAFAQSSMFWDLDSTAVTDLQNSLFRNGAAFRADPGGDAIYGIAGFASLHVSVTFTAALFMERTGQKLVTRVLVWAFFVLTVLATIYFGWHYIADDVAGVLIGWAAVSIGAWASGNRGRRRRRGLRAVPDQPATVTVGDPDTTAPSA